MPVAATVKVALAPMVVVCGCGGVVMTGEVAGATAVAMPAVSQMALPSTRTKAMPLRVLPSRPTALAGTLSRTHAPSAGSGPM